VTASSALPPGSEISAEFEALCQQVMQAWSQAELSAAEALQRLNELAKVAEDGEQIANQGRAEHLMGNIHHTIGNLPTSSAHYERARRLYLRANDRRRVATIDMNMGENYRLKGEYLRARRLYRSAYEAARDLGDVRLKAMSIVNEGLALISLKEYRAARHALQEGQSLLDAHASTIAEAPYIYCYAHHGLASLELLAENPHSAWEHARLALNYAIQDNQALVIGFAWRTLGDAASALDPLPTDPELPDNPDDFYRNALDAFRDIQAEGEIGLTLFHHAKSLAARGKRRPAAQLFREAMIIFTRLGMTEDAARAAEAQLQVM
jgi:tetratricopeptide (TPR) repeat protein